MLSTADNEIWRDIPQDDNYEASNLGRIRSKGRYIKSRGGGKSWRDSHLIKQTGSVTLRGVTYFWDELILSAFDRSYNFDEDQILHIDGQFTNASIDNLKVCPLKAADVEWRDVVGWEGMYQVSADGQVVRLPVTIAHKTSGHIRMRGQVMKSHSDPDGYLRIGLTGRGKKSELRGVHQLVARAFIPNPENKPQINHINGIKSDNRASNLEWVTGSENQLHAIHTGLVPPETFVKIAKINRKRLSKPVKCLQTGEVFTSAVEAESKLGLYAGAVHAALYQNCKVGPNKLTFSFV